MMRYVVLAASLFLASVVQAGEREIVREHCLGEVEYRLSDNTRVDCLTETIAWEYDYPRKWAEAIGQALHYAAMTGKTPGIMLICNNDCDKAIARIIGVMNAYNLPLVVARYKINVKNS